MSSVIQTQSRQPRSSLPLIALVFAISALLISLAVPLIEHLRYYYQYRTGPYVVEAMRVVRGEEQVEIWKNDNTHREATVPLGNLMALDFSTTTPSLRAEARNGRLVYLNTEPLDADEVYKAWDRHLVDQIYALTKYRVPVWIPSENRRGTRLDVRSCYWLIAEEFRAALIAEDASRAFKALEACDWIVKSNDLEYPVYRVGANAELRKQLYELICDSMATDVWSNEQLDELRARFLQPTDDAKRRRASQLETYFQAVEDTSIFTAVDPNQWYSPEQRYKDLQKLDKNGFQYSEYDMSTLPELWRRLAIMSIAAKQFRLANNSWPKSLTDLQQFGVNQETWASQFMGKLYPSDVPDGVTRIELKFIDALPSNRVIEGTVAVK